MSVCVDAVADGQLRYVNDDEPGIIRRRQGRGFSYRTAGGRPVRSDSELARIRALAIPPAWTDVWICADPDGHIQATGRDARGRKQYRYHELWHATRGQAKYALLAAFAAALPKLRKLVDADLRRRGLPREKIVASVVWLLDHTMIRVGNDTYARQNGSFGLTTLRARHLEISGATLRFVFRGKSGKDWSVAIADRRMARVMRSIEDLPGQRLFRFREEDGSLSDISSNDVNAYIRAAIGERFSSKDFRTWGGTMQALLELSRIDVPDTRAGQTRALNAAIDAVARKLGNTRAVCRACYIHPEVFARWRDGQLSDDIAAIRAARPRRAGLDGDEAVAAVWLQKFT